MSAPIPFNEAERLVKLRGYEILDTPPERAFERITRLAARYFNAPMAAVSLLDENRLWRKARLGLRDSEHDRESAFCAHAILSARVLVVRDARADERFMENPHVVQAPHIRFYAGAPLCAEDGHRLGALCVMDSAPRQFTAADADLLADLASLVVDEMNLRRSKHQLRTEMKGHQRTQRTLQAQKRMLAGWRGSPQERASQRGKNFRRQESEAARADLGRIVENGQDFVCLSTLDGWPTFINEAGLRLIGLEGMEQARTRRLVDYLLPEDQEIAREAPVETLLQTGR